MRADRLVLPIPPGLHWSDEMPVLKSQAAQEPRESRKRVRTPEIGATGGPQEPTPKPRAMQFGIPSVKPAAVQPITEPTPAPTPAKALARPKQKIDPEWVAKARELRDRWLERVNAGEYLLEAAGKYDVVRALPAAPAGLKALPQAA
jgi:hypothetical protein